MKIIKRKFRLEVYDDGQMSTAAALYFRPIPPPSPLSLYLHRQPNPFSTRKLKENQKKKKEKGSVNGVQ